MTKHSKHQERIIRNYYENREAIALQRLQELVTELYLSEGKKRERHWKSLAGHLAKLDVPQSQIDHLIAQDSPEMAAKLLERLMGKQSDP